MIGGCSKHLFTWELVIQFVHFHSNFGAIVAVVSSVSTCVQIDPPNGAPRLCGFGMGRIEEVLIQMGGCYQSRVYMMGGIQKKSHTQIIVWRPPVEQVTPPAGSGTVFGSDVGVHSCPSLRAAAFKA